MKKISMLLLILIVPACSIANTVSNTIESLLSHKAAFHSALNFQSINKDYAFVLFYRASCPHCQRFSPIVKQFAESFGFHVYAYHVNTQTLPSFPHSMQLTNQVAQTFFSSPHFVVPSLFLINIHSMKAYLLSQGEENASDLYLQVKQFARNVVRANQ